MVGSFTGTAPITDLADHIAISYSNMTANGIDVHLDLAYNSPQAATATSSPATGSTTSKPASTTPTSHPSSSRDGDDAKALGVTTPTHTQTHAVAAASTGKTLAKTGTSITAPALIATGLICYRPVVTDRYRNRSERPATDCRFCACRLNGATRYPARPGGLHDRDMPMHALRVTLQPSDGAPFIEDAILTLATGANGGQVYSGNGGFWIEVVEATDGTHRVADFGWPDGKRGHTIVDQVPITL